jgi:hypothetical protein
MEAMPGSRDRLVSTTLILAGLGATLGSALDGFLYLTAAVGLGSLARWLAQPRQLV